MCLIDILFKKCSESNQSPQKKWPNLKDNLSQGNRRRHFNCLQLLYCRHLKLPNCANTPKAKRLPHHL